MIDRIGAATIHHQKRKEDSNIFSTVGVVREADYGWLSGEADAPELLF